jgi:protein lifeguard
MRARRCCCPFDCACVVWGAALTLVPVQGTKPGIVLMAAGITAAITVGLTLYALQTKYDFTTAGGILMGALIGLLVVGFVRLFFPRVPGLELAIAGFGALLFSAYIVFDVQMMMDGKHVQLSPDDYIMASLQLYLDIVNFFLYILSMLSNKD